MITLGEKTRTDSAFILGFTEWITTLLVENITYAFRCVKWYREYCFFINKYCKVLDTGVLQRMKIINNTDDSNVNE